MADHRAFVTLNSRIAKIDPTRTGYRRRVLGWLHPVTLTTFLAGYALALALELLSIRVSRPFRVLALVAGLIGLVAHSAYIHLYASRLPLIFPGRWMLYLAWILVVFYLCGEIRQRRLPWGAFVLPVVLGLLGLGLAFGPPPGQLVESVREDRRGGVWGPLHGILILLAAVGVCVGFVASVMYLIQAHRLRTKRLPVGGGVKLLSLERLEMMNRRALLFSFPLLTAGVLAGVVLLLDSTLVGWTDPRVIGTIVLWLVFALLLYLRFAQHVRGRQAALMTIVAFALLLCCLALSHLPSGE